MLLISCTASSAEKTPAISASDAAAEIYAGVSYEEELYPLDRSMTDYMLGTADAAEAVYYVGSGAYADALIVIKSEDREAADALLDSYISKQESSYKSYKPAEMPKLHSYVRVRRGDMLVLTVTADKNAEKEICALLDTAGTEK